MNASDGTEKIGELVEKAVERDYEQALYDEEFEFKKERHELSIWQEWLSPDRFKYASPQRLKDLWKGICEHHFEVHGHYQFYLLSIDEDPGQIQFQVHLLHLEDWFVGMARRVLKKTWSECRKAGVQFDSPHGAGFVRGKVKELLQKAREKLDDDPFCFTTFSRDLIEAELVIAYFGVWEGDIENEIKKLENRARNHVAAERDDGPAPEVPRCPYGTWHDLDREILRYLHYRVAMGSEIAEALRVMKVTTSQVHDRLRKKYPLFMSGLIENAGGAGYFRTDAKPEDMPSQ